MSRFPACHDGLSVVVPVYNELPNLERLVREIRESVGGLGCWYEVVLVDDGSDDGSPEKIRALALEFQEVRGLHLNANAGQTAALQAGFLAARGAAIVTMDADLQNDPADIPTLLEALNGHDAAAGYRAHRHDDWRRRISSSIANRVRNWLSEESIQDTGCSLKAFRAEALRSIKLYKGMHRFLPTLMRIDGYSVVEIPVRHHARMAGVSKYGIRNRVFRSLVDLFAVRWMKRRHLNYEVLEDE
jgi:glycosyltransferase involved in cell wall biosynthesis